MEQSTQQALDCAAGGQPAEPGGPSGYAYFGRSEADFQQNVFADTDPAVKDAVTAKRNRDPCSDNATLVRMAAANVAGVGSIQVPILLLFGEADAVFVSTAAEVQAGLFRSSSSVERRTFPVAGHALVLERAALQVQSAAATWLEQKGPSPRLSLLAARHPSVSCSSGTRPEGRSSFAALDVSSNDPRLQEPARGSETVNRDPRPGRLATWIVPPCASIRRFASASPRPVDAVPGRAGVPSTRKNGSKM